MKGKTSASKKENGNGVYNAAAVVTLEQRQQMIAEAAYYRALQRGFLGGDPVADWLDAEHEIDNALLNAPAQLTTVASHNPASTQRHLSEAQRPTGRR